MLTQTPHDPCCAEPDKCSRCGVVVYVDNGEVHGNTMLFCPYFRHSVCQACYTNVLGLMPRDCELCPEEWKRQLEQECPAIAAQRSYVRASLIYYVKHLRPEAFKPSQPTPTRSQVWADFLEGCRLAKAVCKKWGNSRRCPVCRGPLDKERFFRSHIDPADRGPNGLPYCHQTEVLANLIPSCCCNATAGAKNPLDVIMRKPLGRGYTERDRVDDLQGVVVRKILASGLSEKDRWHHSGSGGPQRMLESFAREVLHPETLDEIVESGALVLAGKRLWAFLKVMGCK